MAANQHSVVAYRQLVRLGLDRGWIHRQVLAGRLHRIHRGVYAVGHPGLTEDGRRMAAVLACGPEAVLSHWHAAAVWALIPITRAFIDVSVTGHRTGPRDVRVHCVKPLQGSERTIRNRIPITTVPRTLLDLAAVASPKQLSRAVNEAERAGWLNGNAIGNLLTRHPRRNGLKALRVAAHDLHPGTRHTLSDLENDFFTLCRRNKLPRPVAKAEVEGYKVDMHWPGTNLIVELDSWEYHRTRRAFEEDRLRDVELQMQGYRIIRVTDWQINNEPAAVAARIREFLPA